MLPRFLSAEHHRIVEYISDVYAHDLWQILLGRSNDPRGFGQGASAAAAAYGRGTLRGGSYSGSGDETVGEMDGESEAFPQQPAVAGVQRCSRSGARFLNLGGVFVGGSSVGVDA